ncbi:actin-like ATPase domain-containing protein [Fistulina hepatica ATCC 64428]|uniref:Actin-like ATPase domain-containing protein n=1 Tax=Fistulina hepatica ATCC 64428 TaxID=1128425 RepID=A0A0D7ARC2_9AGAR|nr:actin-like ATPase domain-containing protein [Fistulina hepatica ATCC 64428]
MPRGIPNAKRDETGMRYTGFHVPLSCLRRLIIAGSLNVKVNGSSYLKSEHNTLWSRNARKDPILYAPPEPKASDIKPITVPAVVARKYRGDVPSSRFVEGISRPTADPNGSPFDRKLSMGRKILRDRMRFYNLQVNPDAESITSSFNEQVRPELTPERNDPFRIHWIHNPGQEVYTGEKALSLPEPEKFGYVVRWPIRGASLNTTDYPSIQLLLSDIEALLEDVLTQNLGVPPKDYRSYSVVLLVPDLYDRTYVREFVHLLLVTMGFRQLCCQQARFHRPILCHTLAATYGAGVSSACIVDMGAVKTTITCVDDGLVNHESRRVLFALSCLMSLNMGGDDITEFLYVLLSRIDFPYRDMDLTRACDWKMLDELKAKMCTMTESDVALNLYDFIVRQPGRPTAKYGLRVYDEVILAPMALFEETDLIEFDRKRPSFPSSRLHEDVTEEILEHESDYTTRAMINSTEHLVLAAHQAWEESRMRQSHSPNGFSNDNLNHPDEHTSVPRVHDEPPRIDIPREASKLPLDVAIYQSARTAGPEKLHKYLQAVLVIGGSARIAGMANAIKSRLESLARQYNSGETVQVIPPPKDVDHRILEWKGAAVLAKMESVSELWITAVDWDILGMRGLKERCFYL